MSNIISNFFFLHVRTFYFNRNKLTQHSYMLAVFSDTYWVSLYIYRYNNIMHTKMRGMITSLMEPPSCFPFFVILYLITQLKTTLRHCIYQTKFIITCTVLALQSCWVRVGSQYPWLVVRASFCGDPSDETAKLEASFHGRYDTIKIPSSLKDRKCRTLAYLLPFTDNNIMSPLERNILEQEENNRQINYH